MAEAAAIDVEGEQGAIGGNENVENDPICETNYIDRIASITREQLSTDLAKRNDTNVRDYGFGQGSAIEDKHYLWGISSIRGFGLLVDTFHTHLAEFTLANSVSTQVGGEQALNTVTVTTRQGRAHEVGFLAHGVRIGKAAVQNGDT